VARGSVTVRNSKDNATDGQGKACGIEDQEKMSEAYRIIILLIILSNSFFKCQFSSYKNTAYIESVIERSLHSTLRYYFIDLVNNRHKCLLESLCKFNRPIGDVALLLTHTVLNYFDTRLTTQHEITMGQ